MPYNPKSPPKDLVKKIQKKHKKAKAKDIKQWINVWNSVYSKTKSEDAAYAQAWGVLKKKFKKASKLSQLSNLLLMQGFFKEAQELLDLDEEEKRYEEELAWEEFRGEPSDKDVRESYTGKGWDVETYEFDKEKYEKEISEIRSHPGYVELGKIKPLSSVIIGPDLLKLVKHIADAGSPLSYLGEGAWGIAYQLGDRVLKIYSKIGFDPYESRKAFNEDNILSGESELSLLDQGKLTENDYWALMEKLKTAASMFSYPEKRSFEAIAQNTYEFITIYVDRKSIELGIPSSERILHRKQFLLELNQEEFNKLFNFVRNEITRQLENDIEDINDYIQMGDLRKDWLDYLIRDMITKVAFGQSDIHIYNAGVRKYIPDPKNINEQSKASGIFVWFDS